MIIGQMLDKRYELTEFIGKGGMALVYRAIDHRTGHDVAVKILRPEFSDDKEFLERFEREALAASKMSHHNIVNLLDVGKDDQSQYLVMEYVNGKTLKEVIDQNGPMKPELAAQICIRILSALQHAHKNGIIHRDIKPQNILVHSEGHIKVSDFGIARFTESNTVAKQDNVMGSVHYISPEQARGDDVTFSSDIYSAGVVLYEMLAGRVPFDGDSAVTVALMHINAKPTPLHEIIPDIPAAFEKIVEKALEKKADLRYQSALEMAQDLQRAIHEPTGDWLDDISDTPISEFEHNNSTESATALSGFLNRLQKNWYYYLLVFLLGLLVTFATVFGVIRIFDSIGNSKQVPYVIGEEEEDALKQLIRTGLNGKILSRDTNDLYPAGTVIAQFPEYDTVLRKGETVGLTLSTGKNPQAAPSLIGSNTANAVLIAEKYGYLVKVSPEMILSDVEYGMVVQQEPSPGIVTYQNTEITVYLSGGSLTVPNLSGMQCEDAVNLLLAAGIPADHILINDYKGQDETKFNMIFTQRFFSDNGTEYLPGDNAMQNIRVELVQYVDPSTYAE